MNLLISLTMFLLLGCSHSSTIPLKEKIVKIQAIWQSKDPNLALENFPEITKLEDSDKEYTLGTGKAGLPLLGFRISKRDSKISKISLWLTEKGKDNADYIQKTLVSDDWMSIPIKSKISHVIENKVSLYSAKLGVSFIYDEYDLQKKVLIIYWGADPKKINL